MTKEELKELDRLSKDEYSDVRQEVAEHPNCPVKILDRLSRDKNGYVRCGVAENPNSTAEILDRLSRDEKREVRQEVANNPNCPIEILDRLSRDECIVVRLMVAMNPSCSVEVLVGLTVDPDKDVSVEVMTWPYTISEEATKSLRSRKETATPEELERIEEMLSLAELGVRFDGKSLDLSKIDI